MSPRIPPLPEPERDEQARELLGTVLVSGPTSNIFTTLVRHPGLFRRWLPFGGKLLSGKLPPRDRELLILRTGWNCGSEYEWGQHAALARQLGLADGEITRVTRGPDAWQGFEASLIRAADQLHSDARISDSTWAELTDRYDDQQLIEVCMVVGHYHLVAFTLNSLEVEREPGVEGFPTG